VFFQFNPKIDKLCATVQERLCARGSPLFVPHSCPPFTSFAIGRPMNDHSINKHPIADSPITDYPITNNPITINPITGHYFIAFSVWKPEGFLFFGFILNLGS
jgi:hypothetical protein